MTDAVAFGDVLSDLVLGSLAIVLGLGMLDTGGTDLAKLFGLLLAAAGLLLIVGSFIESRSGRPR